MWRSEVPRWSIMLSVAIGAAKLTKLICSAAKTPRPLRPKGRSSGAIRATRRSRMPRASSRRIRESMTTITGSSTNSESSTAERPALRMMSIRMSMGSRYLSSGAHYAAVKAELGANAGPGQSWISPLRGRPGRVARFLPRDGRRPPASAGRPLIRRHSVFLGVRPHVRCEADDPVATAFLGLVERDVGKLDGLPEGFAVGREVGNTDRDRPFAE